MSKTHPVIDSGVQPHFRYNAEIRRYLSPTHKLRSIPDVEQQWYQAPGGDYRQDLYGDGYPGSDPDIVARHLFTECGVDYAILNKNGLSWRRHGDNLLRLGGKDWPVTAIGDYRVFDVRALQDGDDVTYPGTKGG